MKDREQKRYASNWMFALQAGCVLYVFFALFCYLPIREDHFEFAAAIEQSVLYSNRERSPEALRKRLMEEAVKRGIPVQEGQIEIRSKNDFCEIKVSYDRDLSIPPFQTTLHYQIDHSVRRF